MTEWTLEEVQKDFESWFCRPSSSTYLPLSVLGPPEEIVPGTVFQLDVEHEVLGSCSARMYCGFAKELGAAMWLQEAQSLLRLNSRRHPALPKVLEGLFRDDKGVGVVLTEARGTVLTPEDLATLRANPDLAFRYFSLVADALRTLHGRGLVHRDIWRGSFRVVEGADGVSYLQLGGFEMSAFIASLSDPRSRKNESERKRLRDYRDRGGAERRFCRAPEVLASEMGMGDDHVTYTTDVFSLGICGFEWFIEALPHELYDPAAGQSAAEWTEHFLGYVERRIVEARHIAEPLRRLLRKMIDPNARTRLTSTDVVNSLALLQDEVLGGLRAEEFEKPLLLAIAPTQLQKYVLIDELRNLSTDPNIQFDEMKSFIEKDLVSGILIHEPRGASPYVSGGDARTQKDSEWVLIGRRAVYFCQKFISRRGLAGAGQEIDWVLHVTYLVDRFQPGLREIGNVPLWRRVARARVVHHSTSAEVDPKKGKGRHPPWTPLLNQVKFDQYVADWEGPFRKGFDWWLKYQRAALDIRQFAFRRVETTAPRTQFDNRRVVLELDGDRDQKRIERGALRHLLVGLGLRPSFGQYFKNLSEAMPPETVMWHGDDSGNPGRRPPRDTSARLTRVNLNANELELEIIEGDPPPAIGWLRASMDTPTEILLQRQVHATESLFTKPPLTAALYDPRSFRGPRTPWQNAGEGLDGNASKVVSDMLAHFPFYALQGPPGTGKTTVAVHAVTAFLNARPGGRVLVSAQSHFALDELAGRLLDRVDSDRTKTKEKVSNGAAKGSEVTAVRVAGQYDKQVRESMKAYYDTAQAKKRLEKIKDNLPELRKAQDWKTQRGRKLLSIAAEWEKISAKSEYEIQDRIWKGANLVFATCGTCTERILGHQDEFDDFDWVVVEEAGRAWPAELVMPLVLGHRWTLIGDHQQLPPYGDIEINRVYQACMSSGRREVRQLVDDHPAFKVTLEFFKHFFEIPTPKESEASESTYHSQRRPVDALDMQFRMDDAILQVVKTFYKKTKIRSAPSLCRSAAAHGMTQPKFLASRPLVWIDTGRRSDCQQEGGLWRNGGEARLVAELVNSMSPSPLEAKRLVILSPYHQQNHQIKLELALSLSASTEGLIHTMDSFQGRESDIVVVSLVRTNDQKPDEPLSRIGFLASPHRANVLLSRAKDLLIIVGDFAHFRDTANTPWREVCEIVERAGGRVEWPDPRAEP